MITSTHHSSLPNELMSRHPQYIYDIKEIRRIRSRVPAVPTNAPTGDVLAIASLMMRYRHLPLTDPICQELMDTMQSWGMTPEQVNMAARGVWNAGYRPGAYDGEEEAPKVGSHFDTTDNG